MISDARQILDATTANEHDAVLLKIVPFAGNIARYLHTIGKSDTTHLAKRRVGLLWSGGIYASANAAFLWTSAQSRRGRLDLYGGTSASNELLDGGHG